MSEQSSSYATLDGRLIWVGRGRWSVVVGGSEPTVWRFRSKSAARRHARDLRSDGHSVRVRAYRRHNVQVSQRGYLEPRSP